MRPGCRGGIQMCSVPGVVFWWVVGCGVSGRKRVEGIEPSSLAWKAIALPLSYTRVEPAKAAGPNQATKTRTRLPSQAAEAGCRGKTGECRIRTCEDISHQIYSLTPLTARETPPFFLGFLVKVNVWCVECDAIGSLKVLVCSGFCFRLIAELLAGLCAELAAGVEPATC